MSPPLWKPSPQRIAQANLTAFLQRALANPEALKLFENLPELQE